MLSRRINFSMSTRSHRTSTSNIAILFSTQVGPYSHAIRLMINLGFRSDRPLSSLSCRCTCSGISAAVLLLLDTFNAIGMKREQIVDDPDSVYAPLSSSLYSYCRKSGIASETRGGAFCSGEACQVVNDLHSLLKDRHAMRTCVD